MSHKISYFLHVVLSFFFYLSLLEYVHSSHLHSLWEVSTCLYKKQFIAKVTIMAKAGNCVILMIKETKAAFRIWNKYDAGH